MDKIAIIGLGCLFPDAETPPQFWQNLVNGKDSISWASEEQMGVDPDIFFDPNKGTTGETGKYYCKRGGYIKNFQFDPDGYRVPPTILSNLDPIYQWSLYVAKEALKDSGYLSNAAVLNRCGILLGNLSVPTRVSHQVVAPIYQKAIDLSVRELLDDPDFSLVKRSPDKPWFNMLTAGYPSAVVAQALALSGMNFSLDAACASSLYAVKFASQYLLSGKADLMLAGAVSCADPYLVQTAFSAFQAYPEDGITRPLDDSSTGMLTAEGAGMLALKRYRDAIRDGDKIYATVLGIELSNDGKGKHFLSPNPKGQRLAFERTYAASGVDPKTIDYIECHATGTPLGDRTELNSIEAFFGEHCQSLLIGSVKSNLGHLLTAAGMPSMLKVILSMSQGSIPPTLHVRKALGSQGGAIADKQIVTEVTPWPRQNSSRRAAVNAFGFGGTNAHLILERQPSDRDSDATASQRPIETEKMAIVGMEAFFGSYSNLEAFERSIYEGERDFRPVPNLRWQGIEAEPSILKDFGLGDTAPQGAYIEDFEMDYLHFKILPDAADRPIPQQLLMFKVADGAVRDAGLTAGGNVAVIIAMGTEPSIHRLRVRCDLFWQTEESLKQAKISLTPEKTVELEKLMGKSFQTSMRVNQALSFIGNIMASRISNLWDFSGPVFTLSAEENSVFKALEVAQLLLSDRNLDAVVVGAVDLAGGVETVLLRQQMGGANTGTQTLSYDKNAKGTAIGEGAGAVVLQRLDDAKASQSRIYAVIDAIALVQDNANLAIADTLPPPPSSTAVAEACQQACEKAGVKPEEIGYLEVFASGVDREDEAEIQGITLAYQTAEPDLTCAIGSVKANIGHTYRAAGMASLIKTALCLYGHYLPATPQWRQPKQPQLWQNSPFYVPCQSTPWYLSGNLTKRVAAINGLGLDRSYGHVILSEGVSRGASRAPNSGSRIQKARTDSRQQKSHSSQYLQQTPFYLFPLAASDRATLLDRLRDLEQIIDHCDSLAEAASQVHQTFQQRSEAIYALAIVGHDRGELKKEIERAITSIPEALNKGGEWKTPLGSYFTARPLGKEGGVAFVYPGAFTAYVGMARDIYHLFPANRETLAYFTATSRLKEVMYEASRLVYPRSLKKLSDRELEALELKLQDNTTAMLLSATASALGFTKIMRDEFRVNPQAAFGYSFGECTMMFALNIWTDAAHIVNHMDSSPLFKNRLSGAKNAVREYWGLPATDEPATADFWSIYLLKTSPDRVRECLQEESHVYLTHINTPEEVAIAGDHQSCLRVIKKLNCLYFPAPFSNAIHCETMHSELDELIEWFTLSLEERPQVKVYSAAGCEPIALDSQAIATSLSQSLCQPLNFAHLIDRVYQDGVRLFVELGPGGTCSRWIRETLQDKAHLAMPINHRGLEDANSLVRLLARLVSHRVSVDLSPLYTAIETTTVKQKSLIKTVTLGGDRIRETIVTPENRQKFASRLKIAAVPEATKRENLTVGAVKSRKDGNKPPTSIPVPSRERQTSKAAPEAIAPTRSVTYQKLSENKTLVLQTHQTFLKERQEALEQMSQLVGQQMAISQRILEIKISNAGEARPQTILGDRHTKLKTQAIPFKSQSIAPAASHSSNGRKVPSKKATKIADGKTSESQKTAIDIESARSFLEAKADSGDRERLTKGELKGIIYQPFNGYNNASIDRLLNFKERPNFLPISFGDRSLSRLVPPEKPDNVIFDEADILEFAGGKVANVFGKEYEAIDAYPRRIRLPMPPYLFVSRVTKLEAKRGCFEPCAIETEYDIPKDAWYAVDGQVPCAIFLEASHGNILLSSYLGIDFENQGERVYRALGGTVNFVSKIPKAGETFRCHIQIHTFTRSGNILLFFYHGDYYVGDRKFLELKSGAGFFSDRDLQKAQGVALTPREREERSKIQKQHFTPLLTCDKSSFDEKDLIDLSFGNLTDCFGKNYHQNGKNRSLRLFPNPIRLLDRILSVDPKGGTWGLGSIIGEKSLNPEHWYFNCHFKHDLCLPGTLVIEGAIQALEFYLLYLGLQTRTQNGEFQNILHLTQSGTNRGQIVPIATTLTYQIEISEIGLEPNPFVKGEASVIFEGKTISIFKNIGVQIGEKTPEWDARNAELLTND